jgi:hypothetical protein
MDRSKDNPNHREAVDAWLERSIDHGSSIDIVRLFHAAVEAIWNGAVTTLGSVTLTAIAERVLHQASDRYAFLSAVNPRPNGDARWRELLHERLRSVPRAELIEGLRFGLIELLTIIGVLTAEILSEELHVTLAAVAVQSTGSGSHVVPTVGAKDLQ